MYEEGWGRGDGDDGSKTSSIRYTRLISKQHLKNEYENLEPSIFLFSLNFWTA